MVTVFLCKEGIRTNLFLLGLSVFALDLFVDFNEDFFESGHSDSVAQNVNTVQMVIELGEEILEVLGLLVTDLENDLSGHF